MKTVGIIGGLGPETTAEFYLGIAFECQKLEKTARPLILISSVPLPYKIEEEARGSNIGAERILPFLTQEAQRLEKAGAEFIVMPCNSLHIFIEEIRKAVNIPVLSIIEETLNFLAQKNMKKVGVVSTYMTVKNRLYENALTANKIEYVIPDDYQQAKINKLIENLVGGRQRNSDREELIKIMDSFEDKNLDCVLLACTDLQLLIPQHSKLKIFDTMKILMEATVRKIIE